MFKEYIKQDIDRVFMNEKEFSEVVTINGVSVVVNIDNDSLTQKIFAVDGVVLGDILFFISVDEFKKIPNVRKTPKVNDALMFNGRPGVITNIAENMGMYEIILQYGGSGR